MVHAAVGYARHAQPAVDASPAPPRSARARPTWSPAPRWPRSTGSRCCCCPATSSPPGSPTRCCRSSRTRASLRRVASTTASSPVSRFWDRINRPEQLPAVAAGGDAGAHRPGRDRRGHARAAAGRAGRGVRLAGRAVRRSASGTCRRPVARADAAGRARRRCSASARRPLIVAGGGVDLRRGHRGAARARRGDRHPGGRDAGRQGLAAVRPPAGASARSAPPARTAANALAREADVVIGVGTRYSDFTTASRTRLRRPGRALRQPQRRRRSTPHKHAGRARWSATPGAGSSSSPRRSPAGPRRPSTPRAHAGSPASGTTTVERAYDARPRAAARPRPR